MTRHSLTTLMQRMSRAGFSREFVRSAILPDWWEDSCSENPNLLQDIEIRIARFLGLDLVTVKDPNAKLSPPTYAAAQLRRVRDLNRDRLAPAIHSALRVAEAVVRNLRERRDYPIVPTIDDALADPLAWRDLLVRAGRPVNLDNIITDLWNRGIPVVSLEVLPVPSFQGMACIAEGHPVVLLGHKHDEPGRVAFFCAHEVGHVIAGDCATDRPVVDEEEEIADDTEIERRADRYATRLLVGGDTVPGIQATGFKDLAREASEIERKTGADASAVIFAWARMTGDYTTAAMAVRALYRHVGARRQLREMFDRYVVVSAAAETDRALLRCVYGDPELYEATG